MQVMEGMSFERPADGKWTKIEVCLDEVDLLRIIIEWWGSEDPGDVMRRIPTVLAYDILSVSAQRLLAVRAFTAGGMTREELQVINGRLAKRIESQKLKVGAPQAGEQ